MFSSQGVCVSSISRSQATRAIQAVGMFMILFFVSGIIHATPIANQSTEHLQNSNILLAFSFSQKENLCCDRRQAQSNRSLP
jgi:hypothetical protein